MAETAPPTDPPTTPPTDPAGSEGSPGGDGSGSGPDRTFTQADLNRIVSDRLAREREKFANFDELKTKAAELDQLKEGEKTELQKAQDRQTQLERENTELKTRAQEAATRREVEKAARKAGLADPEDGYLLIDRKALDLDEDGTPKNADQLIAALIEAKPHLKGSLRPPGDGDQGPRGGGSGTITRDDIKNMSPEEVEKAHNEGRLAHLLGAKQ